MVELESEGEMPRGQVARFLHELADELDEELAGTDETPADAGEPRQLTFVIGGDSATVTVPDVVEFEVEVESRSPLLSPGVHQEIELELSWAVEEPDEEMDDESIRIE